MKLQNEIQLDIPVSEMEDGEIGVITHWVSQNHIGKIVQRNNNNLIALQMTHGNSFSGISDREDCRVRILQKGEILIIE